MDNPIVNIKVDPIEISFRVEVDDEGSLVLVFEGKRSWFTERLDQAKSFVSDGGYVGQERGVRVQCVRLREKRK